MYSDVIRFWFEEAKPAQWFAKDKVFDKLIARRFSHLHEAAGRCELYEWRSNVHGRLAEIIILDQFSRNLFRNKPQAFSNDAMALSLAQEAVFQDLDDQLTISQKQFLYMPFMHSESLIIHDIALRLFNTAGLEDSLEYERRHRRILERFGRYPHRNAALGRKSTDEEKQFLKEPGSHF